MSYIYNDEDNEPMTDDPFDGPHNPTVYLCRAEMKYYDSGQYLRDREEAECREEAARRESETEDS